MEQSINRVQDPSDAFASAATSAAPPPQQGQPADQPPADPSDAFAQEAAAQQQHAPVIEGLAAMHDTDNSFLHRVAEGFQKGALDPQVFNQLGAARVGLGHGFVQLGRGLRELADIAGPAIASHIDPSLGVTLKPLAQNDIAQTQANQEIDDTRYHALKTVQDNPLTTFLASGTPEFIASTVTGMGAEETLGRLIPKASNALLNAARYATTKLGGGAAAVQPMYESADQSRAMTTGLGAVGGLALGGGMDALSGLASGPASKIAAELDPTLRDWLVGRQLVGLSRGLPPLTDEPAMAGVTANLGQATGNPVLMAAAKAQLAKPESQASYLRILASNNDAVRSNLSSLGDAMVTNTGENLASKTQALHDTLTAVHDQMYNEQSQSWADLASKHDVAFMNKPLMEGVNTYLDSLEKEDRAAFPADINYIRSLLESNQGAARGMKGTTALRSNLMDAGRATAEANPKAGRIYKETASIVNDYMHDPTHVVDEGGQPLDPHTAMDFGKDFDAAREDSRKFFSMWSDSGLGDLVAGRGGNEFRRGTDSAVSSLLGKPKSAATADLALNALARAPEGLQQAKDYALAKILDKASDITQTSNGMPTIDPARAYKYLDQNMGTLQKIFPDNADTLTGMRDTFEILSRKSNLTGSALRQIEEEVGGTGFGAMLMRVMFAKKYAVRNAAGEITQMIPATKYQQVLSDALLDSRVGKALMQKATAGNIGNIMSVLGKYTSGALRYGIGAPATVNSLSPKIPPAPDTFASNRNFGQITDASQPPQ